MTEGLAWLECFPPRDLKHTDLTGLVRILAGRPRHGVLRLILQGQMYGRASLTCDDASPVFPATRHFSSI